MPIPTDFLDAGAAAQSWRMKLASIKTVCTEARNNPSGESYTNCYRIVGQAISQLNAMRDGGLTDIRLGEILDTHGVLDQPAVNYAGDYFGLRDSDGPSLVSALATVSLTQTPAGGYAAIPQGTQDAINPLLDAVLARLA